VKYYDTFNGLALIARAATVRVESNTVGFQIKDSYQVLGFKSFWFTMKFLGA